MNKKSVVILIVVIILLIGAVIAGNVIIQNKKNKEPISKEVIMVFKSPTCGCCENYIAYLKRRGYSVKIVEKSNEDMYSLKQENMVPGSLQSCHTSLVSNYVVEGHIPAEAIEKLLKEKPEIRGIALAGMPYGAPGMTGSKSGPFLIHIITLSGEDGGVFMEL